MLGFIKTWYEVKGCLLFSNLFCMSEILHNTGATPLCFIGFLKFVDFY